MEASGYDLYSYRRKFASRKKKEREREKTSSNEFPVIKALTSTREKCAPTVCTRATIASTSHMFSSFKKRRFIGHQIFGTISPFVRRWCIARMDVLLCDILSSMVELQRSRVSQNSDALNSTFTTRRNIAIFLNHVHLTFIRISRCPFWFANRRVAYRFDQWFFAQYGYLFAMLQLLTIEICYCY